MDGQTQRYISYGITALIIIVVLGLRFRSLAKERPLKLNRLWVLPAIYTALVAYLYTLFPPSGITWLYDALALAFGAGLGWMRGKMMQITLDRETQSLTQKASPAAMLFIVGLIALRMGSRMFMGAEVADGHLHRTTLMVTGVLITMALGFLAAQRLEMYLRGKRILAAG